MKHLRVVMVVSSLHPLLCLRVPGTSEETEAHREVKNIVLGHLVRE